MTPNTLPHWMSGLEEDDWQFLKRFVLLSGCLKDLATEYGISYPTVRLRLDRLIEKIKVLESSNGADPFRTRLQLMVANGELSMSSAKTILREFDKAQRKDGAK